MGCCKSKTVKPSADSALNGDQSDVREIDQKSVEIDKKAQLGRGSFAAVFKGRLISGGGTTAVAIKEFRNGWLAKNQFNTEVAAMKLLSDHDHILRAFGFVSKPKSFIVIEFMNLGSLQQYIKEHHLDNESKIGLSTQIADGMSYMFTKKFTHGDLATHNVLLIECGISRILIAKISDFGTATCHSAQAIENESRRKDVWDFGHILRSVCGGSTIQGNQKNSVIALKSIENIRKLAATCEQDELNQRPLFPVIFAGLQAIHGEALGPYDSCVKKYTFFRDLWAIGPSTIFVVGMPASGKSSIIRRLSLGEPIVQGDLRNVVFGNTTVKLMRIGDVNLTQDVLRNFQDKSVKGVVLVVDCAATNIFDSLSKELDHLFGGGVNVPVLVLANKQDHLGSANPSEIGNLLKRTAVGRLTHVVYGIRSASDRELEEGMQWLVERMNENYPK